MSGSFTNLLAKLMIAVALVAAAVHVDAQPVRSAAPQDCSPIIVADPALDDPDAAGNAGEVSALISQGWSGKSSDGKEAIYAPGC